MRFAVVGGDGHAARLKLWKERFEFLIRHDFYFVHDRNQRLIAHSFFAELQRRDHAINETDRHAIGQGMIGSFFGSWAVFVRIAENVRGARDHFDFDFLHVSGLDVVFLDGLHHGGKRRVTERFNREAFHPAIENSIVRLR